MSPTVALQPPAERVARPEPGTFLHKLRAAVIAEHEPEINLVCQVAVLHAAGYRKSEIGQRLGATGAQLKAAFDKAKGAAIRLDPGDPT